MVPVGQEAAQIHTEHTSRKVRNDISFHSMIINFLLMWTHAAESAVFLVEQLAARVGFLRCLNLFAHRPLPRKSTGWFS